MFGVGMPELMIIFVIALLVFGPKELPKIAKTLGKAMSELRRASDDLRDGIQREIEIATREEKEAQPSPPEPLPPVNVGEIGAPGADAQVGVGAQGQGAETPVVEGASGAGEPGSQVVAAATHPASEVQPGQPIVDQAAVSSDLPAEPAQAHVAQEESTGVAEQAVPEETQKEASSLPETVPHVPAQPAEPRHA